MSCPQSWGYSDSAFNCRAPNSAARRVPAGQAKKDGQRLQTEIKRTVTAIPGALLHGESPAGWPGQARP
jgi:hypothetical protein